jgi:hypothetical protein
MAALHTSCRPRPTSRLVGPHPHGILAGCLRTGALRRDSSSTFRLRDGCSASTWTAPDGSRLLTLDGPSVQTAPDGSRLIVWMIIGMIKAHPTNYRMARQAREVENSRRQGDLLDDELMTSAQLGRPPGQPLRTAAVGGLAFTVLYLVHRILQGTGPGSSAAAAVATTTSLIGAPCWPARSPWDWRCWPSFRSWPPLVSVIWRAGQETLAVAVGISGGVFVAMGFVSTAAETALLGVADSNQPAAVLALDQLQGRTPVVWTITALVAALSLAIQRTSLVWRWLGVAGLIAAAIFALGSIFSVLGRTPEGTSSLIGVGIFIVWMLLLSAGLWRAESPRT